jgi:hypothetical protein
MIWSAKRVQPGTTRFKSVTPAGRTLGAPDYLENSEVNSFIYTYKEEKYFLVFCPGNT